MCTHHQNPTLPSPAMLVGSSLHPQTGRPFAPTNSNTRSSPTPLPTEDFQSFTSALVSHLRVLPGMNFRCPKCDTTVPISIVELAQLFAPQLKAFDAGHHSSAGREANALEDANVNPTKGSAPAPPSNAECRGTEAPTDAIVNASNGPTVSSPPSNAKLEKETQHPDVAHATEPVFKVKRKSKNGDEALNLKPSDLSPLFSLRLPNAAKELGISPTLLKNACRMFGIDRWPGRKVRGLESTVDGLERTIVGQGADSGNTKVAHMRSEIPKLQQELDELVHGTPAQITQKMHSPAATTTNVYKSLYVQGWRSKFHNPGRHDINTGNQPNLTSGLAPPSARKNSTGANRAAKAKKQPKRNQKLAPCTDDPVANQPTPNAGKESPRPSPRKYIRRSPRPILRSSSRLGSRATEMKASDLEGLLPEVHVDINVAGREVPESVVQAQNGNNLCIRKTEIGEEGIGDGEVAVEEEGATIAERSAKRPKMEPV